MTDIKEYSRKIRLAEYFYSVDTEKEEEFITEPDLVRNKSTFNPKRVRNVLDTVYDTLENIPLENNGKRKQKSNLTKEKKQVQCSLKDDCSIMDSNFYENKIT